MDLTVEPTDTLYPISMLIDDLKDDNQQSRLNSINRLKMIAKALGQNRTRQELLPFLSDFVTEEDDVLCQLAVQLGDFVPLVGGPQYVEAILEPLKFMLNVEESKVREEAVNAIKKISESVDSCQIETIFVPLIKSLISSSWFVSKISSSGLFVCFFPRVSPNYQRELITMYKGLFLEDVPLVKKAAASNLGEFLSILPEEVISSDFLAVLEKLKDDEQDNLRLLTLEAALHLRSQQFLPTLLSIVRKSISDDSWRVRHTFIIHLRELQVFLGPSITQSDLIPAFKSLLQDVEPEIRVVAVSIVFAFCNELSGDIRVETLCQIMPTIEKLVYDPNIHVKSALASVAMKLSLILGKEGTIDHLVPIFLAQLRDDVPEVRLNVISNLDSLNSVIGTRLMSESLVPAIVNLSEDTKWRVRLAIVDHMPLLAVQLGEDFFDKKLSNLCLAWLTDPVYGIREAAVKNLLCLTKEFGVEWSTNNVIPALLDLSKSPNYQFRITAIFSLSLLGSLFGPELTLKFLLTPVLDLSKDKVPNVRMNTCKAVVTLSKYMSPSCIKTVIPHIQSLESDLDFDVRYFAMEALEVLQEYD